MPTYRVCVVGMTFGLTHARAWQRLAPRAQLVGIAEMDESKRQKLAGWIGRQTQDDCPPMYREILGDSPPRLYDDALEMMDHEKPDVISIAVAPKLNPLLVPEAARRGIHVVCEKPIAPTLAEADAIIEACRDAGVALSVGHQRRNALHPYTRAKAMLDEGRIGRLTHMTGCWPHSVSEDTGMAFVDHYGGGNLMFLGTHVFDLFRFYAGDPTWVFADLERVHAGPGPETGARVWFGFGDGVTAYYEQDENQGVTFDQVQGEVMCLYGEDGAIRMPARGRRLYLRSGRDPQWQEVTAGVSIEEVQDVGVRAAREAFLNRIEGRPSTVSTGEDGRWALEMALAAYESNRLGGVRVAFPTRIAGSPLLRALRECPGSLIGAVPGW